MAVDQIYALCDPDTGDVRYIGKSNNPKRRYSQHLSFNRGYPVSEWIQNLKKKSKKPVMKILASAIGGEAWKDLEPLLIKQYIEDGAMLLNVSSGGIDVRYVSHTPIYKQNFDAEKMHRINIIKRMLIQGAKKGYVCDGAKEKMRLAAKKRPDLFGVFLRYV